MRLKRERDAIIYAGNGLPVDWRRNPCPQCEAGVGQFCRRTVGARVDGKDTGGSYTVRLKNPHQERRG